MPSVYESLAAVSNNPAPARDMADLAARYQGVAISRVAQTEPIQYYEGDVAPFWIKNLDNHRSERIEAVLAYRSDALNMWIQKGETIDTSQLIEAAHIIESQILPTDRAFFGVEWQPGVDGDSRINILHLRQIEGIGIAYFWSGDEYVTAVNPYSNQREMLYVSLKEAVVGSDRYYMAIAHEMQHLIQWHTDINEDAWLNEGLGELAAYVNGFSLGREKDYVSRTDIQLTTLSQKPDIIAAHYAASTLFSIYFLDRFGEAAMRDLVQHAENGSAGFDRVLADLGTGTDFDGLFADWLVANYLEGIGRGQGIYQYTNLDLPPIKAKKSNRFPATGLDTVNQYGADFIQWHSEEPVTLVFTGTQQVRLIDADPHSGRYFWLSSPADESDMSLTRAFNLGAVGAATLTFWTWYDIEAGWDYGYVAVSQDDGNTWDFLETDSTTWENPQGNNIGAGLTGNSGDGEKPEWVQETADLSPYAGQTILIRFQYVTDDAVHEQGLAIDDIAIPELAYFDDVEGGDDDWQAVGFARTGQFLPQRFILQQLLIAEESVQVNRLQLDENQQGQWEFPMDKRYNTAILIVSGATPVTRQPAIYRYEIHR